MVYDDYLFISTEHFNYMIAINLNAARNKQLDISQNTKRAKKSKHTFGMAFFLLVFIIWQHQNTPIQMWTA